MKKMSLLHYLAITLVICVVIVLLTGCSEGSTKSEGTTVGDIKGLNIIKHYQKDTGKLIYSFTKIGASGAAMIDASPSEKQSEDFLHLIESIKHAGQAKMYVAEDIDNGNIVVITIGNDKASIDVQAPNSDIK